METTSQPIRAFIALALPDALKQALGAIGQELEARLPGRSVRWVKPDAMHLTLTFLGDGVTPQQVTQLTEILDKAAAGYPPFHLHTTTLGCFPKARAPRVLWVGIGGDIEPLQSLKQQLDQALEPLGWQPEKRAFHPHLTLGRVNDTRQVAQAQLPYNQPVVRVDFEVAAVHLYRSRLTPQGARYSVVHSAAFGSSS